MKVALWRLYKNIPFFRTYVLFYNLTEHHKRGDIKLYQTDFFYCEYYSVGNVCVCMYMRFYRNRFLREERVRARLLLILHTRANSWIYDCLRCHIGLGDRLLNLISTTSLTRTSLLPTTQYFAIIFSEVFTLTDLCT